MIEKYKELVIEYWNGLSKLTKGSLILNGLFIAVGIIKTIF